MIKKDKLIKPLLLALVMAGMGNLHAEEINGRLFMPLSDTPNDLIGHEPGIKASVSTNSERNNGIIYTGNTLKIDFEVLDTDLDWADSRTIEEIEKDISWFYLKPNGIGADGQMTYIPDSLDGKVEPFQNGGTTYKVQRQDVGKIIGVSIISKTTTGVPNISELLEIYDLRKTFVLVPEGQEAKYGGQSKGTIFNAGAIPEQNNITDLVIQACPGGETCDGTVYNPEKLDIVIYKNIAKAGEPYVYEELQNSEQEAENLRVKTWYGVKVFAMDEDPANPGQYIRSNVDLTERYQNDIVWELFDPISENKQSVKATYNPLRKQMEFKTQKFNDDQSPDDGLTQPESLAQSTEHGSQQGMKFEVTVNF